MSANSYRIYLAGPMTGYPLWNFPAFRSALNQLRAAQNDSNHLLSVKDNRQPIYLDIISPAEHDKELGFDPFAPPREFTTTKLYESMKWDLDQIINRADALVYLPGSEESSGASLEISVARATGKHVLTLAQATANILERGELY